MKIKIMKNLHWSDFSVVIFGKIIFQVSQSEKSTEIYMLPFISGY